ncbi:MAG: hypothetical protein Q9187_007845 [Circinaria calcarea]
MVVWNYATLRHLTLGRTTEAVNLYVEGREIIEDEEVIYSKLQDKSSERVVHKENAYQLSLFTLHFIGISIPLENTPLSILKLEILQNLCLESCAGVQNLLSSLALVSRFTLKRFSIRQEGAASQFCNTLERFLASFSGLEHLFVLLDQAEDTPAIHCFTGTHGETLKTLVWEGRIDRRSSQHRDTSTPLNYLTRWPSDLDTICEKCTKLEEIGFATDWRDKEECGLGRVR